MRGWAVIDANLLLLLVVGQADPALIEKHKRLRGQYTVADFRNLEAILAVSGGIIVVPQVLAEVSNLARYIAEPARRAVMAALGRTIGNVTELYVASVSVVHGPAFHRLGLTDAILLALCSSESVASGAVLLSADTPLADRAESLGCTVLRHSDF